MASPNRRPHTSTTTTTTTTSTTTVQQNGRERARTESSPTGLSDDIPAFTVTRPSTDGFRDNAAPEPFPSLQSNAATHRPGNMALALPTASAPQPTTPSVLPTHSIRRRPISLKRLSTQNSARPGSSQSNRASGIGQASWQESRRRSTSEPQRPGELELESPYTLRPTSTVTSNLPPVRENRVSQFQAIQPSPTDPTSGNRLRRGASGRLRRASDAARSAVSRISRGSDDASHPPADEYEHEVLDVLDVLDPEVSTLTTLTNVQNSLFVPYLGSWFNRGQTYDISSAIPVERLSQRRSFRRQQEQDAEDQQAVVPELDGKPLPLAPGLDPVPLKEVDLGIPSDIEEEEYPLGKDARSSTLTTVPSIVSQIQPEHYAVLPHGVTLEGWTPEEKELLDDHVRHMLHSRRSKFKRSMKAFGKYVRQPLGFFVTVYATLITLFGLAWVLFLIGWIYVGKRQAYLINIIDNVLVALFALVGDGLAPFRLWDTWNMAHIAHYHRKFWRLRKERGLPKMHDHNDLPDRDEKEVDVEAAFESQEQEFMLLSEKDRKTLIKYQERFSKSHTYYKPHETATHHAFPLKLLIAIIILLDCHSALQIALGSCTWGISYHHRPKALTPTILSCSITVNILAGVLIKIGDNKTRKKDVLERMFRQELTRKAIKKVGKQKKTALEHERQTDAEIAREEKHTKQRTSDSSQESQESSSRSSRT